MLMERVFFFTNWWVHWEFCVCFGTTFNKINIWWQFFERCAWSMTPKSFLSLEIAVGVPVH